MLRFKIILTFIYIFFSIIMIYISRFGFDLYLNNIGTVFLVGVMIIDIRKDILSKLGFLGLFAFSSLHSIGACFLYSYVPYNEWIIFLFDFDLNSYFNFQRNHYDRLVHFLFGVFLFPAAKDLIQNSGFSTYHSLLIAFLSIQTFSMMYELLEWGVAVFLSPERAENYNGQQGDIWDAHKDMALAMIGSFFSFSFLRKQRV